jgi:heterodisulfide reductase subunit A-like polyferredoxin
MEQYVSKALPAEARPVCIGKRAVVIGAGIAGMAAAGALADWFEQ